MDGRGRASANSVNGKSVKRLKLRRIVPGRGAALPPNAQIRYIQLLWLNPYLLFLILILLLLSFSAPYPLAAYVLEEES